MAAAADFGNGVAAELDFESSSFINPDLTISVHRPPVGEWICLDARTRFGTPGIGAAESALWDVEGRIGRSVQNLVVEAPAVTDDPVAIEHGPSVAELLVARAEDDHPGLRFEDEQWRWRRGGGGQRGPGLVDPVGGRPGSRSTSACSSATSPSTSSGWGRPPWPTRWWSGINPTRRGEALAGDIRRTDCEVVVTDADGARAARRSRPPACPPTGSSASTTPGTPTGWRRTRGPTPGRWWPASAPPPSDLYLLLFTSGTTGDPQGGPVHPGPAGVDRRAVGRAYGFDRDDVAYCTMPLFHGNALMVLWGPSLVVGATVALARRFSASGFVADVRRYRATTFTYVGKALAYVLATPPSPDDASFTLRRGFGTEASVADHAAFERRFGCVLTEGYGSSEGGVAISRTPDTPVGSLGRPVGDIAIVDPETGRSARRPGSTPPAGCSTATEAIGEIVNRAGIGGFEGYYADEEATASRTRNGWYWTGDLAYRDEDGFFYFAGRRGDWMRVDSENLTAGPIERVLVRHPGCGHRGRLLGARPTLGRPGDGRPRDAPGPCLRPGRFAAFLDAQPDLGTKWSPSFVRVTAGLPQTASGKVTKDPLRAEGWWQGDDPVYRRQGTTPAYVPMDDDDRAELRAEYRRHGRAGLVGG